MKYILIFLSFFVLASCQAKTGSNVHDILLVKLFRGLQCPLEESTASAHWVSDSEALQQLINSVPKRVIGQTINLPSFDFKQRRLLLVSMGQRPSAGYQLVLQDEKLGREGKDLVLYLRWKQPDVDGLYAAVITYPCVWLDMPKLADIGVRILDGKGKQHFYLP